MRVPVRHSLGRFLEADAVLRALGVEPPEGPPPARACCPTCRGDQLGVYPDPLLGGPWFHCRGCYFSGDGIQLAAAALECPAAEAAALLLGESPLATPACKTAEAFEAYERDILGVQDELHAFWAACQRTPGPAFDHFGLPAGFVFSGDWPAACRALVGFAEDAPSVARSLGLNQAETALLFPGGDWGPVLVVPLWDLPGRIRGFLFCGRASDPAATAVLRVPHPKALRGELDPALAADAGVAFLYALPAAGPAVVAADPGIAIRLHLAHLRDNPGALPLLLAPPDRRYVSGATLGGLHRPNRLVGWSPCPDAAALAATRRLGAELAIGDPPYAGDPRPPRAVLADWLDAAAPWEEVAANAMVDDPGGAAELAAAVGLTAAERRRIGDLAGGAIRGLLLAEDAAPAGRVVRARGRRVRATPDAWWAVEAGGEELVTDAPFRVEGAAHLRRSDSVRYSGVARFAGADVPFDAPGPAFEADPGGWLRKLLIARGLGVPIVGAGWGPHLLPIALQLHAPRATRGLDRGGWDPHANVFVYPRFVLDAAGGVRPPAGVALGPDAPGADFEPPDGLTLAEARALSRPEAAAFWAVAGVVLAGLVAGPTGRYAGGLLVTASRPGDRLVALAAACGCVVAGSVDAAWATIDSHGHPVAVANPPGPAWSLAPVVAAALPPGTLAAAEPRIALAKRLAGGWNVLGACADGLDPKHGRRVVPNYLKDLAGRRFALPSGVLLDVLMADLADWFDGQCGDPAAVRAGAAALDIEWPWSLELAFAEALRDPVPLPTPLGAGRLGFDPGELEARVAGGDAFLWAPSLKTRLEAAGLLLDPQRTDPTGWWVVDGHWWGAQAPAGRPQRNGTRSQAPDARATT